eukprot:GGOE01023002.1.p1 GENE.GGOE01023002.1~~GGOE01023002.1.p1  ORF type:complete len:592 (+),score=123.14 GGOE01023002.1:110-1885(+)
MAHLKVLVDALEPTPSISRLGRNNFAVMHTSALVKSTAASFSSPKKKGQPRHVEIMEESQLDKFGTAKPALDASRAQELVSSPRNHPIFQAKAEAANEVRQNFLVQQMLEAHPSSHLVLDEASPATKLDWVKCTPKPKPPNLGSPCFRTVPRQAPGSDSPEAPPFGHYRPRFNVVDRTVVSHSFGSPHSAERHAGSNSPTGTPKALAQDEVSRSPSVAGKEEEDALALEEATMSTRRLGPEGTSSFLSTVKSALEMPANPMRSPDRFYYPYNEVHTAPRLAKGACVEFDKQLSPGGPPAFSSGPDVFYNAHIKDRRTFEAHNFQKSVSRIKARRLVATHHNRGGIVPDAIAKGIRDGAMYHPNESATTKFKKDDVTLPFTKTTGRQRTEGVWPSVLEEPPGPVLHPMDSFHRLQRHTMSPDFPKQSVRKSLGIRLEALNLDYDPQYHHLDRRVPGGKFQSAPLHPGFHPKMDTMNLDYNPSYTLTSPRTDRSPDIGKFSIWSPMKVECVDQFYDPEATMVDSRVTGDPMIGRQMSREKWQQQKAPPSSIDKFYDYDPNAAMQRTIPPGHMDFAKSPDRQSPNCSRLARTNP